MLHIVYMHTYVLFGKHLGLVITNTVYQMTVHEL